MSPPETISLATSSGAQGPQDSASQTSSEETRRSVLLGCQVHMEEEEK